MTCEPGTCPTTSPVQTLAEHALRTREGIGLRRDKVTVELLVCCLFQSFATHNLTEPVSDNPLETGHGNEGPPRKITRQVQPGTPRDPINLQGGGQLGDLSDIAGTGVDVSRSPLEHSPIPALPPTPANRFSREKIANEILDLTDHVASTALFGPIGVGKSFVALALLHDDRTRVKFGRNRHFMRCDNLTNSLEGFLERLSDAIGIDRTTDIGQLRSHLESSPPLILLLDGVDSVLDPLAPEAEEISATIEEFGSYRNICLLTTSRMHPEIPGFHRVEVPTLSGDGARDAFYGLCHLGRSPVVDDLIAILDFHPLFIDLLTTAVRENGWDDSTLMKAWDNDQIGTLKTQYQQSLKDAVESSFRSPTIRKLGSTARDTLNAIAAFPGGIEECRLENIFPGITGVGVAADGLCKFSLIYRQGGFVKMLSPFRLYFLDSMLEPARHVEVIPWDADCNPAKACMSFSPGLFYSHRVTLFQGLPIYTAGPPERKPPKKTKPPSSSIGVIGSRNPQSPKRSERGNFWLFESFIDLFEELLALWCLSGGAIDLDLGDMQAVPADTQSDTPVQQGTPAVVEVYDVE